MGRKNVVIFFFFYITFIKWSKQIYNLEDQNNIIDDIHNNIDIYDILQFNNLMELIIKLNKGTKEIFSQIITKIIEPYMYIPVCNCFLVS